MSQLSFASGFERTTRRTRKQVFLEEMLAVVPWDALVARIAPHAPPGTTGRPPYPVLVMLRIHFLQQWFALADEAVEDALHDVAAFRAFVGIDPGATGIPDATTVLRFRHLLERHRLAAAILATVNGVLEARGLLLRHGTAVDATIVAAPGSTRNRTGTRDPEMRQTRKGNQWYFGMKAHVGVDAGSGLVHSVVTTAAHVHDLDAVGDLLHGEEVDVHADAGYRGVVKRGIAPGVAWHVAMRPGRRRLLPAGSVEAVAERAKAQVRAKVEHPFRVVKRQFGHVKARYRGLAVACASVGGQNGAQLVTLFALSNLWMARRALLAG